MTYRDIVSEYPGAQHTDSIKNIPGGNSVFYNGIPTIRWKTELAGNKASGIMIWQLAADSRGSKSLLKVINKVALKKR